MWGGWGWHPGMIFIMLLFLVAIVLLTIWLVRGITGSGYSGHHHSTALDILAERFARGEIDKNEFEEKHRLIRR